MTGNHGTNFLVTPLESQYIKKEAYQQCF